MTALSFLDESLLEQIKIEIINVESITEFDIYIFIGGNFILYASAPYYWSQKEIDLLKKDGFDHLYYSVNDKQKVEQYLISSKISLDDYYSKKSTKDKLAFLNDTSILMTRTLFEVGIDENILLKGKQISALLVDLIGADLYSVNILVNLQNHDDYTYSHSTRVSAYSIALSLKAGIKDKALLQKIAMGALFHDVGKSKISLDILNKKGKLDEKEWILMKSHPQIGSSLIGQTDLDGITKDIVLYHHERLDGKGYPFGLHSSQIPFYIQIVTFCDTFDALVSNRSYQKALSKFDAMTFIQQNLLKQLNSDLYYAMIDIISEKS